MTETAPTESVPTVNLNAESEYDVVDRRQSVNFINTTLGEDPELQNVVLPLDPETQDLYQAMRSGVLILKLINAIEPGTISKDVIKKRGTARAAQVQERRSRPRCGGERA